MNLSRPFRFIFIFLLLAGSVLAQTGKIDNIAEQAAAVTEFDVNGLKVIVKRRPSAPTVAAGLFIRGGAANLNENNEGIESFALSVAAEGSKKFPRQTLRRELSRMGGSINAGSGKDFSALSFVSTRDNFDRTWEIFTDIAVNPGFAAADVERVRQQMLTALREAEISPDGALHSLQERVIYSGHPYSRQVGGTIKSISGFKAADLQAYHKELMKTSRLLLVVVGDVDAEGLKARVARSFGSLPRGNYKPAALPALDFSKGTVDVAARTIPTNYVEGVFHAPALSDPDYFPMRVAVTILRQLVHEEVRNRRQLSYAPDAELDNFASNTGSISVTAVDANQAVKVMLEQIEFLKSRRLSEEALAGMTGQFLTSYYLAQETNAAQVGELARYELIGGGWRNAFQFLNRIREVKPEHISAVANTYMKNIRFAVIGDQQAVNKQVFLGG